MNLRFPGALPGGLLRGRLPKVLSLFALVLLAMVLSACGQGDHLQSSIGQEGLANERIWSVYNLVWVLTAIVFVLVEGLLVYTFIKYRNRPNTPHGRPAPVHGNTRLEVIWTVIPAIILAVIAVPSLQVMAELDSPPSDREHMSVEVVGHQFFFEFKYEDEGLTTTNTLTIPADTIVDIKLHSADVIHSFWVPKLNGKTDNIPGRTNKMWIHANNPGVYHGQCAEFCGLGHALMRFEVHVLPQADYVAWVADQKDRASRGGELAQQGQQIAQQNGCTGCHSIDGGTSIGPTWQGLFGHDVKLVDGSTVTADEAYLTQSIREPGAAIVEGYQNMMPAFPQLSDDDIQAIIAYIESLGQ